MGDGCRMRTRGGMIGEGPNADRGDDVVLVRESISMVSNINQAVWKEQGRAPYDDVADACTGSIGVSAMINRVNLI